MGTSAAMRMDLAEQIAIKAATGAQILMVTGIDVEKAVRLRHLQKKYQWKLEEQNTSSDFTPTPTFVEQLRRYDEFFDSTSKSQCRSSVHVFMVEAVCHHSAYGVLKCYGEAEFSMFSSDNELMLSGQGDSTMAWGNSSVPRARNVSLIVEVRSEAANITSQRSLIQVLTYMAIAYKERLKAKKANPGVLGIVTNSVDWVFLRIDNEGIPSRTGPYIRRDARDLSVILRHLAFVVAAAMSSSPATSAVSVSSMDDLATGGRLGDLSSIPNFAVVMRDAGATAERSRTAGRTTRWSSYVMTSMMTSEGGKG
ncbi:hypothetical protein HKX48_004998 [Thoreauomyces humboldtii]|nr:hypothetical protein HKX48_004998 [Thoreauomyces humboldtii]